MSVVCRDLHLFLARRTRHTFPFASGGIPANGIFVLFEKGEKAHTVDRIVGVGTHTGENQLPTRIKQHFVNQNKDRSLFRKNIGRAMLSREHSPFLEQWEWNLTTPAGRAEYGERIDLKKLDATEARVSAYIQANFQFCVGRIDAKSDRVYWESKLASTISICDECEPSLSWLGSSCPMPKIQSSGLWLGSELNDEPMAESEFSRFRSIFL